MSSKWEPESLKKTLRILSFLRFLEVGPYFQGPLLLWVTCEDLGPSYTFSYLGVWRVGCASQITPQITNVTWHGCLGFYWRVQKTCCTINGEEYHHWHLNEGGHFFSRISLTVDWIPAHLGSTTPRDIYSWKPPTFPAWLDFLPCCSKPPGCIAIEPYAPQSREKGTVHFYHKQCWLVSNPLNSKTD